MYDINNEINDRVVQNTTVRASLFMTFAITGIFTFVFLPEEFIGVGSFSLFARICSSFGVGMLTSVLLMFAFCAIAGIVSETYESMTRNDAAEEQIEQTSNPAPLPVEPTNKVFEVTTFRVISHIDTFVNVVTYGATILTQILWIYVLTDHFTVDQLMIPSFGPVLGLVTSVATFMLPTIIVFAIIRRSGNKLIKKVESIMTVHDSETNVPENATSN